MYSIYNAETLENLIHTVHHMHNSTMEIERLFVGQINKAYTWYINEPNTQGSAIESLLYLRTIKDKYIQMYKEFISQLCIHVKTIRILAKGYLPISLITPLKKRKFRCSKNYIQKTNPDYYLVIKRLHLYYHMKLVTFGIDTDRNLIIQFPIFIQPYTQQPLILYKIERLPVPIIDQNTQAHLYTHLQMHRPYIAFNSETYITIRQQELRTCERIGYESYCEELFIVKHKSKYSHKSAMHFDIDSAIIKKTENFTSTTTKKTSPPLY